MSNADPWMGSNMEECSLVGSRLLVGATPMGPASAAGRPERMSALHGEEVSQGAFFTMRRRVDRGSEIRGVNTRFVATLVSILPGFIPILVVIASTSIKSTHPNFRRYLRRHLILKHHPIPMPLIFVTTVKRLRGRAIAVLTAKRRMRVIPCFLKMDTSVAVSQVKPRCPP